MTSKCQIDAVRWLRSNANLAAHYDNQPMALNLTMCAEEVERLRAELAALKEAAMPVVEWYTRSKRHFPDEFRSRDVALEYDGPFGRIAVACLELDALAALVGEE